MDKQEIIQVEDIDNVLRKAGGKDRSAEALVRRRAEYAKAMSYSIC